MKSKIREVTGQRIGQLIYNAIVKGLYGHFVESEPVIEEEVVDRLFYIEDDKLIRLVQNYINELRTNNGKM